MYGWMDNLEGHLCSRSILSHISLFKTYTCLKGTCANYEPQYFWPFRFLIVLQQQVGFNFGALRRPSSGWSFGTQESRRLLYWRPAWFSCRSTQKLKNEIYRENCDKIGSKTWISCRIHSPTQYSFRYTLPFAPYSRTVSIFIYVVQEWFKIVQFDMISIAGRLRTTPELWSTPDGHQGTAHDADASGYSHWAF